MEVSVNYKLRNEQLNVKSEGEAKAVLDEKYLTLFVDFGEPLLFSYTDIFGIAEHDYTVDLFLSSKEILNLSRLGYQYEDFLFNLYKLRNELLLKYMLMQESLLKAGFEAQFSWFDDKSQLNQTGNCELRLYDTALLVLPQKGEPIRVPYCFVSQTTKGDYKFLLTSEFGEKFEFSRLGEKFDGFANGFSDAFNRLMLKSQAVIKELLPEADPAKTYKLANLMKDGKAAKRKDLELLSPDLWRRLSKRVETAGLAQEFGFLEDMTWKEQVCVGLKRGLMGDLTGDYVWFLFPLCYPHADKLGNAVALEAFSTSKDEKGEINETEPETETENLTESVEEQVEEGPKIGGRATYFFRILNRGKYAGTSNEALALELDKLIKSVNRCMIDINFRREPIYLSEESLDSSRYVQYRYAIAKIASLRLLRDRFVGRIFHLSFDQWKSDVLSLLAFNANNKDDTVKWKEGE